MVCLYRINDLVLVKDLGAREEKLEGAGDREFADAGDGVDVGHWGWLALLV